MTTAADVKPDVGAALSHFRLGRWDKAEAACRRVLGREAENPAALHLLGLIAQRTGRAQEALALLRRAVAAAPHIPDFHNNLAIALAEAGMAADALTAFDQAIRLRPAYPEAHRNRAVLLDRTGRLTEAQAAYRAALQVNPADLECWQGLLAVSHALGDMPTSVECRRRIVELRPDDAAAHSHLLVALQHQIGDEPEAMLSEHVEWAKRQGGRGELNVQHPTSNAQRPTDDRRLRIGYLGPCFRRYAVARFLAPVLRSHDRERAQVFCYNDVPRRLQDDVTRQFQGLGHEWRDISALDDDAVAGVIGDDRIDVLVDLAGHMDNPRMRLFSRRLAPVQATYIGYPGTTGLSTMDWRITDSACDVPGEAERWHTERLLRIDPCCWCYDPEVGTDGGTPPVAPLPAESNGGRIVFAAFNRLLKATDQTLALWRIVLESVPGSALAVIAGDTKAVASVRDRLAGAGFDPARLIVHPPMPRPRYLALYDTADILLDTFPYAGMTTTCDALWMGVPAVTLAGRAHVSRIGVTLLSAVGLGELIAQTPEQYVEAAVRLASDVPKLAELRRGLRQRMAASSLCDGPRLARALEQAYQEMRAAGRLSLTSA